MEIHIVFVYFLMNNLLMVSLSQSVNAVGSCKAIFQSNISCALQSFYSVFQRYRFLLSIIPEGFLDKE